MYSTCILCYTFQNYRKPCRFGNVDLCSGFNLMHPCHRYSKYHILETSVSIIPINNTINLPVSDEKNETIANVWFSHAIIHFYLFLASPKGFWPSCLRLLQHLMECSNVLHSMHLPKVLTPMLFGTTNSPNEFVHTCIN